MKATFKKQIIVTAISIILSSVAYAGQKSVDFQKADKNGDGAVSYNEAKDALDIDINQFSQADIDNNDQLSRSEYEQWSADQYAAGEQDKSSTGQNNTTAESTPGQPSPSQPGSTAGTEQSTSGSYSGSTAGTMEDKTGSDNKGMAAGTEQGEHKSDKGMAAGTNDMSTEQRTAGTGQGRMTDTGLAKSQPSNIAGALMTKTVDDIKGMDVKNQNDDEVGDVSKVVLENDTNKLYAVVSVGGFLGIGDKLIPIELNRFKVRDDELVLPTSMTEDELKNTQAYNEDNYLELKDDQMISQATAPSAQDGMSSDRFATLDQNSDGKISREEATQGDTSLSEGWDNLDQNKDEGIDRTEFSAFEEGTKK